MKAQILRDYQELCCQAIMDKLETYQSTMAVLFTSAGKTVIFANIIMRFKPKRVLVIAGQDSLVWQAKRSIEKWASEPCGVEMAEHKSELSVDKRPRIVIATWQSLISGGRAAKPGALFDTPSSRRMHKFKPTDFDLIVIDEFHHAAAKSYRLILDYFKQNPNLKILGVTATPKRGDGLALGEICESVAFDYHILQGAENGWLVDIVQHPCHIGGLDYSHLKIVNGDFDKTQLKSLLEKQENIAGMIHPLLEVMFQLPTHALDDIALPDWGKYLLGLNRVPRKTLLFTTSVLQSEMSCDMVNRVIPGLGSWVCGKTDPDKRKEIFRDFESGKTALLANVGITTEGYDCPEIEVIAMGRPTLSITSFIQMLGRGIRVLPGVVEGIATKEERLAAIAASKKPNVRVIDFKGNTGRHNLMTTFDVLGGRASEKTEYAKKRAAESTNPKSVLITLSLAEKKLEEEKKAAIEKKKLEEQNKNSPLVPKATFSMQQTSPFQNNGKGQPMPTTGKQFLPATEPQMKTLRKYGFPNGKLSKGQATGIFIRLKANKWKLTPADSAWMKSLHEKPKLVPKPDSQDAINKQILLDIDNYHRACVGL